jgi:hypothetical protein
MKTPSKTNPLSSTIDSLVSNVSRHAAARPNHPALASYETIAAVLEALGHGSRLSAEDRDQAPHAPPSPTGSGASASTSSRN